MIPGRPVPVLLLDAHGAAVVVTGRGEIPDPPVLLVLGTGRARVTGFSNPWPLHERPWEPDGGHRTARLQVTVESGAAYLLGVEAGDWFVIAGYQ
jgi:protein ImuB